MNTFDTITVNAYKIPAEVTVSLCSTNGPLQARVQILATGQWTFVRRPDLTLADVSEKTLTEMAGEVMSGIKKCRCGKWRFDKAHSGNRGTKCEDCFLDKLREEIAESKSKERVALAKNDQRMVAKGFTHRIDAWIHGGGDDRLISFYSKGSLTKAHIKKIIKKEGSAILDDYTVHTL